MSINVKIVPPPYQHILEVIPLIENKRGMFYATQFLKSIATVEQLKQERRMS